MIVAIMGTEARTMDGSTRIVTGGATRASSSTWVLMGAALVLHTGCGGDQTRNLDPQSLAMTSNMKPFYDDGELKLYETQLQVALPVRKPSDADSKSLDGKVGPFAHHPWVTAGEVQIQLSWTLANLDKDSHAVEVLIDPWNEFGRYRPGIAILGDNAVPNLSGIDETYDLPGLGSGRSSRIEHTYSFDDMNELAVDFATAINILATVKPMAAAAGGAVDDPRVGLVNHVFNVQNRHGSSPLTDGYVPPVIPGLLGFDLGLRTLEPANIAIEFAVELVDANGDRVVEAGSHDATLVAPRHIYSLAGG
jgi:hypothetical protein